MLIFQIRFFFPTCLSLLATALEHDCSFPSLAWDAGTVSTQPLLKKSALWNLRLEHFFKNSAPAVVMMFSCSLWISLSLSLSLLSPVPGSRICSQSRQLVSLFGIKICIIFYNRWTKYSNALHVTLMHTPRPRISMLKEKRFDGLGAGSILKSSRLGTKKNHQHWTGGRGGQ